MMVLVVWLPALPPVPMSRGMKKARETTAAICSSKWRSTLPVSVSVRNSSSSQPTRLRTTVSTPESR